MMRRLLLSGLLLCSSPAVLADAFTECPSRAFLTQDAVAKTYGVNLVTGDYGLLQDNMGTKSKINATGFNPNDNYLYGWGYEKFKPVRINSDFTLEYLDVENIAVKKEDGKPDVYMNFYVGDVSLTTNTYYVYRRGADYGLYAISLDETSDSFQKMVLVPNSNTMDLKIFDIAFHPSDGFAYSVDRNGKLHQIDVKAGSSVELGDVGVTGTFGAVYFDVDENLYISRNNDGRLFKVAVGSGDYTAQLFALGPSSSINDGARCALAPIADVSNVDVDFGDAPESYGTYLKDNGARHGLSDNNTLYLGSGVDGESDGKPMPLSDDESDRNDDEDGVQFATSLQAGDAAVVMVEASEAGVLSAWIDSDQNGTFDTDEQIITDYAVTAGKNPVYIDIPADSLPGSTWSRFRLSSSTGMEATGGVSDGEVEDHKVNITVEGASVNYYPSSSTYSTVVYEDNWPFEGDYDMNDLVANLQTTIFYTDKKATVVNIKGQLSAVGAAYHNGFGIRLPGVLRDQIDEKAINYTINDRPVGDYSPLESGTKEAIFILAYNTWSYVSAGEDCTFYRTEEGCGSDVQMRFNLTIPMVAPIETDISGVFDPFLFATPGAWHGNHFDSPPGRSYEIHLKNHQPTEVFDSASVYGLGQDASNEADGHFFLTTKGLPWAMEVGNEWKYPKEYRDVTHAYPKFPSFVRSSGLENPSWFTFENAVESILFEN